MELIVHSLEHFGEVCVLRLRTPDSFPVHQVGHYAVLQFANFAERPYSIANAPNGQFLEFHIKNSGHAGGSTFATHNLEIGDTVIFHRFGGNYTLVPNCPRPLILVAGGTGLSPMLAITEASFQNNPDRPIFLYYGARHHQDLYYDSHLREKMVLFPNFSYIPTLSEENKTGIKFGSVGDIALQHPELLKSRFYVAGPVDMLRTTIDKALAVGVSPDVIHSDVRELDRTK